jgi:hypothetical protein
VLLRVVDPVPFNERVSELCSHDRTLLVRPPRSSPGYRDPGDESSTWLRCDW